MNRNYQQITTMYRKYLLHKAIDRFSYQADKKKANAKMQNDKPKMITATIRTKIKLSKRNVGTTTKNKMKILKLN